MYLYLKLRTTQREGKAKWLYPLYLEVKPGISKNAEERLKDIDRDVPGQVITKRAVRLTDARKHETYLLDKTKRYKTEITGIGPSGGKSEWRLVDWSTYQWLLSYYDGVAKREARSGNKYLRIVMTLIFSLFLGYYLFG